MQKCSCGNNTEQCANTDMFPMRQRKNLSEIHNVSEDKIIQCTCMAQLLTAPSRAAHEINTANVLLLSCYLPSYSVAIYCISLTSSTHSSLLSGILHLISLATSKRCISRAVNPSFLQLLSSHKRTYKEVSNMLRPKASGLALQTLQKYFLLMF